MSGTQKFLIAVGAIFLAGGIVNAVVQMSAAKDCAAAGKTFSSTSVSWSCK